MLGKEDKDGNGYLNLQEINLLQAADPRCIYIHRYVYIICIRVSGNDIAVTDPGNSYWQHVWETLAEAFWNIEPFWKVFWT